MADKICAGCDTRMERKDFHQVSATAFYCVKCEESIVYSEFHKSDLGSTKAVSANERAAEISRTISQASSEISFNILIWGENPKSSSLTAKKRIEIRENLCDQHSPYFSEDSCQGDEPYNLQERMDSDKADLLVCLASDYGPMGEAHELLAGLGSKVLVWFYENAKDSFAGGGIIPQLKAEGAKVEFFDNSLIKSCCVKSLTLKWINDRVLLAVNEIKRRERYKKFLPKSYQ